MQDKETTVRIKPEVWELIQLEQRLGESKSATIERVFKERFVVYDKIMEDLEMKEDEEATQKAWEGEKV